MDKAIYNSVCRTKGHNISCFYESVLDEKGSPKVTSLQTGAVLVKQGMMCTQCGAVPPFEDVRVSRPRSGKKKGADAASAAQPESTEKSLDNLD